METAVNWLMDNGWLVVIASIAVGYSVVWSSGRAEKTQGLTLQTDRIVSWVREAALILASMAVVLLLGLAALASGVLLLVYGILRAAVRSVTNTHEQADKESQTLSV